MTLFEGHKSGTYEIRGLYVEEAVTRRLQALGLNDGTRVKVLNRKRNGALIIQVRGTRLALGRHLSSGIEVREAREAAGAGEPLPGRTAGAVIQSADLPIKGVQEG